MSVNVWNTSVSDSLQQTPLWPPKEFLFSFVKLNACSNLWARFLSGELTDFARVSTATSRKDLGQLVKCRSREVVQVT